jgi:RNA polymerase sigma-70 factor, ECF subfamily
VKTVHPLAHLADEDLMCADAATAPRAFEVIYDRHSRPAYSLAYRILGSHGPAEDAVQEAFLTLWRNRSRYLPERGGLRAWLLPIVHARSVDVLRRNAVQWKRQTLVDDFEEPADADERSDAEVIRQEEATEVRKALAELSAPQQKVIVLAYFGGYTHREIADLLEEPLGTVKDRMRRGLQKLHGGLTREVA